MEFDDYGSHIHVLEKIYDNVSINSVLEFGMGLHSTPFFVENSHFVMSIEQQDRNWYDKMLGEIKTSNWHHRFETKPEVVFEYEDLQTIKIDLVFSDGLAQSRPNVSNMAMQRKIPFVILHDSEKVWYYGWNRLEIPEEYSRFDFRSVDGEMKVTTILTNSKEIDFHNCVIEGHERIVQAHLSPSQPIVQVNLEGKIRMVMPGKDIIPV